MGHIILSDPRTPNRVISDAEEAFRTFTKPADLITPKEFAKEVNYDPTYALKELAKTAEAYWKSKGANDGLMMTRVLEGGEVEISGNGLYMTCSQKQFDELMEIFDKL